MAKKKKKKDDVKIVIIEGAPSWMCTMGDCMSLLLCFFVLLLTFSTENDEQLLRLLSFIQGASSAIKVETKTIPEEKIQDQIEPEKDDDIDPENKPQKVEPDNLAPMSLKQYKFIHKKEELERKLKRLGFEKIVTINLSQEGIYVEFDADEFFEKDKDVLLAKAEPILKGFIDMALEVKNEVRLIAYLPRSYIKENGRFTTDWRLSISRLGKLEERFEERYETRSYRISRGTYISNDIKKARIRLLLVEKLGAKEMSPEDLTNELLKLDK